jgi:hypothetical protein
MTVEDNFAPTLSPLAPARPRGGKLSEILTSIAANETRDRVSVADLFDVMRDRAFGALMLLFAVPNVFPLPPGSSAILAAPLVFLTAQLALARPTPWLPRFITERSISRSDFARTVAKVSPWLARIERLLRPRLGYLTRPPFEQLIGVMCLILAILLLLPIPLGNMPPALAICLFSLAILERDGIAALVGWLTAIVSIAIVWTVVYALVHSAIAILRHTLSV